MANKIGEGVHNVYKERAQKGGDILWHAKIKGQTELTEGIPLHMSLKVFEDKKDMNVQELKEKVKEFGIKTPDVSELKFKTTVFTSERDEKKYYMLLVEGTDKAYEDFYESLKHCGTVYKKFMPHITIDKGLYDKINEEGLKPEEVEFEELSIEHGAGNTIHEFKKSLDIDTMKETIAIHVDLNAKHAKARFLAPIFFQNYLQDNQGLSEQILNKHEDRINHHFGNDTELIAIAWTKGIKEAYKLKDKK